MKQKLIKAIQITIKTKSLFFEKKNNKIYKPLSKYMKRQKKKTQVNLKQGQKNRKHSRNPENYKYKY